MSFPATALQCPVPHRKLGFGLTASNARKLVGAISGDAFVLAADEFACRAAFAGCCPSAGFSQATHNCRLTKWSEKSCLGQTSTQSPRPMQTQPNPLAPPLQPMYWARYSVKPLDLARERRGITSRQLSQVYGAFGADDLGCASCYAGDAQDA